MSAGRGFKERENTALIEAFARGNFGPLAELLRNNGNELQPATYKAIADHLEGLLKRSPGRPRLDHDLIARRFWWLRIVDGLSHNEARRRLGSRIYRGELPVSEDTIKNIVGSKSRPTEASKIAKRETRVKLSIYDAAEIEAYRAEIFPD